MNKPLHNDIIIGECGGYTVTCTCGLMPEVWRATNNSATDAWIAHVDAEESGIFDEQRKSK